MTFLQTLIAFIGALGTLIVVHEFGHYLVARWCGVKVLRFSVGMGKVVFSRRLGVDQTEWVISALPFGGYVKMLDAREQDIKDLPAKDLQREFTRQNVWKRIAIVAAGPIANFILAIALFAGLYIHGIPEPSTKLRTVPQQSVAYQAGLRGGETVTAINGDSVEIWSDLRWKFVQLAVDRVPAKIEVRRPNLSQPGTTSTHAFTIPLHSLTPKDLEGDFLGGLGIALARPPAILGKLIADGPAMLGGLQEGDLILEVNNAPIADGLDLVEAVRKSSGQPLNILARRASKEFNVVVTPESQLQNGQPNWKIKAEVALAPEMVMVISQPVDAIVKAVKKTWDTSTLTLKMFGKMLVGDVSWKNITGPITIADYAGQTARIGAISYLSFIAFISISLGVMNLLPIPVLDGGHLLYYFVEILTGRPLSARFCEIAQRAGLGILMTLMIIAVFNDIVRLIS